MISLEARVSASGVVRPVHYRNSAGAARTRKCSRLGKQVSKQRMLWETTLAGTSNRNMSTEAVFRTGCRRRNDLCGGQETLEAPSSLTPSRKRRCVGQDEADLSGRERNFNPNPEIKPNLLGRAPISDSAGSEGGPRGKAPVLPIVRNTKATFAERNPVLSK